ncbi:type II toxin-antitoxin system YafQ family toxin [Bifidobacterium catulorum]|nr:type II toxin-antitoxin system YafQ family toxin [Bifidobacterium catulorum]
MVFEIRAKSKRFDKHFKRLARYDASLAEELVSLMYEALQTTGRVPEMYRPHVLSNPGGLYNNCMEFHLADDVLVVYYPPDPDSFVRMLAILTHDELRTGRFHREWPRG